MTPLDRFDLALLERIRREGAVFIESRRSARARDLASRGLVSAELALYSVSGGGQSADFRQRFKLTDAGRQALVDARTA